MQRAASAERKTILKQQRNLIMKKLSTDNMMKMRVRTPREKKSTGPLKVVQSHTESIMSETSLSMKSSSEKEVYSILSHHSISKITEMEMALPTVDQITQQKNETTKRQEHIKKILLMKESELKKRRKSVEQLIQWQKRLVEEEQRINELEVKANTVISQKLSTSTNDATEKYKFKGRQLNQLWYNVTGIEEKKFLEDKVYQMSQIALERFCKSAREYSTKTKKLLKGSTSDYSDSSVSEKIRKTKQIGEKESQRPTIASTNEYASDFDAESITNEENAEVIENISELINNFGKIKTNILSLSITNSKPSEDKEATAKTDSDLEVSVIETNRTSKDDKDTSVAEEVESEIKNSSTVNEEIVVEKDTPSLENVSSLEINVQDSQNVSSLIKFHETDEINLENERINNSVTTETQENLNKSKEILILLGEPEENIDIGLKIANESDKGKENVDTSEDILLTLTQIDKQSTTNSVNSLVEEEISKKFDDNIEVIFAPKLDNKAESDDTVSTKAEEIDEDSESIHSEDNSHSKLSQASILANIKTNSSENLQEIKTAEDTEPVAELVKENDNVESEIITSNSESLSATKDSDIDSQLENDVASGVVEEENNVLKSEIPSQDSRIGSQLETETKESDVIEDHDVLTSEVVAEGSKVDTQLENETTTSDVIEEDNDILESAVITQDNNESHLENEQPDNDISETAIITKDSNAESHLYRDTTFDKENSKEQINIEDEKDIDENSLSENKKDLSHSEHIHKENSCSIHLKENQENVEETETDIADVLPTDSSNNNDVVEELFKQDSTDISSEEVSEKSTGVILSESPRKLVISFSPKDSPESSKVSNISLQQSNVQEDTQVDKEQEKVQDVVDTKGLVEGYDQATEHVSSKLENGISNNSYKDQESVSLVQNGSTEGNVEIDILSSRTPQEDDNIKSNEKVYEDNSEGSYKITDIEEVLSEDELEINKNDEVNGEKLEAVVEENKTETSESALDSNNIEENDRSSKSSSSDNQNKSVEDNSVVNSYTNSFASHSGSSNSRNASSDRSSPEKSISNGSAKSTSPSVSPRNGTIDVKKRVLEIMSDTSQVSRGDKSPKLQDLYVTTYGLTSPANSPESGSPIDDRKLITATIFGNEAEEILKKQLAIEQEIKQITEQQKREQQQIPFVYVREIPNKPPPPYTPPSAHVHLSNVITINPTFEEIDEISKYSSKILYKAYLSKNLDNISISENTLSLISKNIPKERYKYVFDLCKDLAKQQYEQFEEEKVPSWLRVRKKPHLNVKPLDAIGLEKHIAAKLKEIFGYSKTKKRETALTKWSKKKYDHVDEILAKECQTEETQWTNYEKDELLVMDQLTNDIMDELLEETGEIFKRILASRH